MKKSEMKEYIRKQERVSIPELQAQFSLKYASLRKLFHEMESDGEIAIGEDGLYFRVLVGKTPAEESTTTACGTAKITEELLHLPVYYRKSLKYIAEVGTVDVGDLHRRFSYSTSVALTVLGWMEDHGVTHHGVFQLSKKEWQSMAKTLHLDLKRKTPPAPPCDEDAEDTFFQADIESFLRDAENKDDSVDSECADGEEENDEDPMKRWEKLFNEEMEKRYGDNPRVRRFGSAPVDEESPDDDPAEDSDSDEDDDDDPDEEE